MMYAHIYNHYGEVRILFRKFAKFSDAEDEAKISKNLIATIAEETGDDMLLIKKVLDYAVAEGIEIVDFPVSSVDKKSLEVVAALPLADRVEMLETSVRTLSVLLEKSLKEAAELRGSHALARRLGRELEETMYLLRQVNTVVSIAGEELGCEHINTARLIQSERKAQAYH